MWIELLLLAGIMIMILEAIFKKEEPRPRLETIQERYERLKKRL
jgi:hypothetical protein